MIKEELVDFLEKNSMYTYRKYAGLCFTEWLANRLIDSGWIQSLGKDFLQTPVKSPNPVNSVEPTDLDAALGAFVSYCIESGGVSTAEQRLISILQKIITRIYSIEQRKSE